MVSFLARGSPTQETSLLHRLSPTGDVFLMPLDNRMVCAVVTSLVSRLDGMFVRPVGDAVIALVAVPCSGDRACMQLTAYCADDLALAAVHEGHGPVGAIVAKSIHSSMSGS